MNDLRTDLRNRDLLAANFSAKMPANALTRRITLHYCGFPPEIAVGFIDHAGESSRDGELKDCVLIMIVLSSVLVLRCLCRLSRVALFLNYDEDESGSSGWETVDSGDDSIEELDTE